MQISEYNLCKYWRSEQKSDALNDLIAALIQMEKKRDAEDACRELNGTRICGNR